VVGYLDNWGDLALPLVAPMLLRLGTISFANDLVNNNKKIFSFKVLTALRFFASGSYQQDIGEHRGAALSQPSVSRCITEVAEALNNPIILNKYIHFPSTIEQLNIIRQG